MTQYRLKHSVTMRWPEHVPGGAPEITLPEGLAIARIEGADGIKGALFVVAKVKDLIRITGNSHDPVYRYCVVPEDACEVLPD